LLRAIDAEVLDFFEVFFDVFLDVMGGPKT